MRRSRVRSAERAADWHRVSKLDVLTTDEASAYFGVCRVHIQLGITMLIEIPLPGGDHRRFRVNRPGSFRCIPCERGDVPTLIPVDGEGDDCGADLCERCTARLFDLPLWARSTWPALTPLEVERLWASVRAQQVLHEAVEAASAAQKVVATLVLQRGAKK